MAPLTKSNERWRYALALALAIFFGAAGSLHILAPRPFLLIMPSWVPWPMCIILVTGACEIIGAIGLLSASLRPLAAFMLGLYALCVWPANIKHAVFGIDVPGLPSTWWYHGPRLLMQPVLIWASLYAGGLINWPFSGPSQNTSLDN